MDGRGREDEHEVWDEQGIADPSAESGEGLVQEEPDFHQRHLATAATGTGMIWGRDMARSEKDLTHDS